LDAALLAPAKKIRVWEFEILSFCLYSRVSNGLFENFCRNDGLGLFFSEFLFPPSMTDLDYEIQDVLKCWRVFIPT